ncbi:MAG: hypothetical protein FJ388_06415 [Verrucomicrobia bacterium]|nr:hypothetical protein [Verrucomicrobiota bacterium]
MRTPNRNLRDGSSGSRKILQAMAWCAAILCWEGNPSCGTAAAAVKATMISPTNGTRFIGYSTNFVWNAGSGVSKYALWVGSTNFSYDIAARLISVPVTNQPVTTLPVDGRNLYVTLFSLINGVWEATNSTYQATNIAAAARMTNPPPRSALLAPITTFVWSNSSAGAPYGFWVGSSPGGFDVYGGFEMTNWRTVTLPGDGRTIYTTLWSLTNVQATGGWVPNSYAYTAPGPTKAEMISPPPGTTNFNEFMTFEWDKGVSVSRYALWVGSIPNSYDWYAAWESGPSRTVRLPVDGRTLYVTLWSWIYGAWQSTSYTYKAAAPVGTTPAQIYSPANGATLGVYQYFFWSNSPSATRYALWVGSAPSRYDLYAGYETSPDVSFSGAQPTLVRYVALPSDGRQLYVTLWSWINNAWVSATSTYSAASGPAIATLVRPRPGMTLGNYTTFRWNTGSNATPYMLWVGTGGLGANTRDLHARYEGASRARSLRLPADGRQLSVTLWSMVNSVWGFTNYTYRTFPPTPAKVYDPPDGSVLDPTAPTLFRTDGGVGVTRLALRVGTTPLGHEIRQEIWESDSPLGPNGILGTITNLPPGTNLYVTLWSFINGAWQRPNTYTYTTTTSP